jgi:Periplasmic protein involved in polysaccharide export
LKRFLLAATLCASAVLGVSAQMSDHQVSEFIAKEIQAGTSQGQIVTRLLQKGVRIEQIRRLRKQYDKQLKSRGMANLADGAVTAAADRLEAGGDGTIAREVTIGRRDVESVENDVMAIQNIAPDTDGKEVFGRNIFSQANPNFQPNVNLPIPDNYVLGTGDQVVVDIYGASQTTLVHTISPEGTITVAGYGPIHLSGLTVAGAQTKLRSTIGSRYQTSKLSVTVGNTRTIQVNIMGEVKAPGTYHLSAFANLFYALYRAGGTTSLGTLRSIKVYRNGRLITVVDLYDYILNGRLAGNIRLQDNDVVQVEPYQALVGISGNVKRPMYYEMRKDESLGTLVRYAGGFTSDAYKKSLRLIRQTGDRYTIYNVDEFDMNTFKLDDGDSVTVDGILDRFENMVEIKGAVFRAGQFRLDNSITTVRGLVEAAAGLTEEAFPQHAIIHRLKADRSLEIVPVNVEAILAGTEPDVPLKNEDVLFIPTQEELRKERNLTITGEVMTPGTYEYADHTTVEDLIVQAGGLRDGASLARVDVSRRINDPYAKTKSNRIAETFTFDIKEGLVVKGEKGFELQPYDIVHVRRSPGFVMPRNITVTGEVNYEGTFTLQQKNLRLTDAVRMAGGIAPNAYVRGARLHRTMNDEERQRRDDVLETLRLSMNSEDHDSIMWNKMLLNDTYIIGIELDKALADSTSDYNIVLREGDHLDVPEYNPTVRVSGDVQYPNTITYVEGKGYKWYANKAGGFSESSKKRKAFVIYPNGMMAKLKSGTNIEPGSEIIIPSKRKFHYWKAAEWLGLGNVISSFATTIAMISYLTR